MAIAHDRTGVRYGRWTALSRGPNKDKLTRWICRCDCGVERLITVVTLTMGTSKSCGCIISGTRRPPVLDGDVMRIPLTKGFVAVVDLVDGDLGKFNWAANERQGDPRFTYATRGVGPRIGRRTIYLHNVIAERAELVVPDGFDVDHEDGDRMNNRRLNLRPATRSQNSCNAAMYKNNTSGAKGVWWSKKESRWIAAVWLDKKPVRLGAFRSFEEARVAREEAAARHYGEFARTG
jgi:hypothetical protein